jgi:hypothetical protein
MMVVKRNQRRLYEDLTLFFQLPAIPADQEQADRVTTISKGHGRLETRTLECSTAGADYMRWPGIGQILRRTCERVVLKTGKRSVEVSYGLTNLTPDAAGATQLEALWRGHWTIENRKQVVVGCRMVHSALSFRERHNDLHPSYRILSFARISRL